jgi:hypothetical protein
MELLFTHEQEKKDRLNLISTCNLKLSLDGDFLVYISSFYSEYLRHGVKITLFFEHQLHLNLINGDFSTGYKLNNNGNLFKSLLKNKIKNKTNDFIFLDELLTNGFYKGEKRTNFWGVKYSRATDKIFKIVFDLLKYKFQSNFLKTKEYENKNLNDKLFELIVDFHLDCKKIKGHDNIYFDIKYNFPKKKYLKRNEDKFLPAILDEYGIKSKYLISELNKEHNPPIHLKSLKYLCNLFGENYVEYLKKIPWEVNLYREVVNKKIHTLKNESEKKNLVTLFNKWQDIDSIHGNLISSLNKLLSLRGYLEKIGFNLKFQIKNNTDLNNQYEVWYGHKKHLNRGYRLRYNIDSDFVKFIQEDIEVNGETFKPKLLLNEEEFIIEGTIMKNCMSKQFSHGVICLFVSLKNKNKRVNLQYRKGTLVQSYGKANTQVPEIFNDAIYILTQRFKKNSEITWKKEKYDFIEKVK